jgi:hypothetical protein
VHQAERSRPHIITSRSPWQTARITEPIRTRIGAEEDDPMPTRSLLLLVPLLLTAGGAQGAVKYYNSLPDNGTPNDSFANSPTGCPPVRVTPGQPIGIAQLSDDGLGTVTLEQLELRTTNMTDLGEDFLGALFGPGAFIFVDRNEIRFLGVPHASNASGIGAHGPSGTGPGESTEWGIVSGWLATGNTFCLSSPTAICDQNGFGHGATTPTGLPSSTYDLGTWNFDATGSYEAASVFIIQTVNGGMANTTFRLRGAFVGASLPALPLVGIGALAAGLAVMGARAIRGRK